MYQKSITIDRLLISRNKNCTYILKKSKFFVKQTSMIITMTNISKIRKINVILEDKISRRLDFVRFERKYDE